MAGRMDGKVVVITGAAWGQGRAHAVSLAEEGADIIAVDICESIPTVVQYGGATPEDRQETVKLVEAHGRRIIAEQEFRDVIDVNLVGVWNTVIATAPVLVDAGSGGSIVLISSGNGLKGGPFNLPCTASKFGVTGMGKTFAAASTESLSTPCIRDQSTRRRCDGSGRNLRCGRLSAVG